jgi:hypothetical protein
MIGARDGFAAEGRKIDFSGQNGRQDDGRRSDVQMSQSDAPPLELFLFDGREEPGAGRAERGERQPQRFRSGRPGAGNQTDQQENDRRALEPRS